MAKTKARKKASEPVVQQVNEDVAVIGMVKKRYKMVPVDIETHDGLMQLCEKRGLGTRGQGAMVRILVKAELAKLPMNM